MQCLRRSIAIVGAGSVVVGCSLIDLDGFSQTPVVPDGGSTNEGGGPGPEQDGSSPSQDAGADVGGPVVDDTCPPSDPTVFVCEDFETGDVVNTPVWTDKRVNGTLAVQPGIGRDGSRGLRALQVGQDATSWPTSTGLVREIDMSAPVGRTLVISFWFTIHQVAEDVSTLAELQYGGGPAIALSAYTNLNCPNGKPCLSWGNHHVEPMAWESALPIELNTWHRAEITFWTTTSGRSGRVAVDGRVLREKANLESDISPQTVHLTFGALFGATTNEVTFDDLVIRRITE